MIRNYGLLKDMLKPDNEKTEWNTHSTNTVHYEL